MAFCFDFFFFFCIAIWFGLVFVILKITLIVSVIKILNQTIGATTTGFHKKLGLCLALNNSVEQSMEYSIEPVHAWPFKSPVL